jgi:hypothetical protein
MIGPGGYSAVFMAWVALCDRLEVTPINKQPGGYFARQVDEQWWLVLNAMRVPQQIRDESRGGTGGNVEVPPFTLYVSYNGWPAGLLTPFGGILAAGEGANEDSLLAALEAAAR